jgi:hypothetical protein
MRLSAALLPNPPCPVSTPHLRVTLSEHLLTGRSSIARRQPRQIFDCEHALSTDPSLSTCLSRAVDDHPWADLAAHGPQGPSRPVTVRPGQAGHFGRQLGCCAEFRPISPGFT